MYRPADNMILIGLAAVAALFLLASGCAPTASGSIIATSSVLSAATQTPETTVVPVIVDIQPAVLITVLPSATPFLPDAVVPALPSDSTTPEPLAPEEPATPNPPVVEINATPSPVPPTYTPPAPPPLNAGTHFWFQRPVPAGGVVWTDKAYPYGSTRGGTLRPHTGVEFFVPTGTQILAASAGTVQVAGDDMTISYGPQPNFYGKLIIIKADDSLSGRPVYHLYGHLSDVQVTAGQRVNVGDIIGLSGDSGVAYGPHLHFEVRVGENSYQSTRNPLLWLIPLPGTGLVTGRITWPDGSPVREAPVTLSRVDALSPFSTTTTYAIGEPSGDDTLQENFAVDDLIPGYYQVIIDDGAKRHVTEMWVFAGRINHIEITLEP